MRVNVRFTVTFSKEPKSDSTEIYTQDASLFDRLSSLGFPKGRVMMTMEGEEGSASIEQALALIKNETGRVPCIRRSFVDCEENFNEAKLLLLFPKKVVCAYVLGQASIDRLVVKEVKFKGHLFGRAEGRTDVLCNEDGVKAVSDAKPIGLRFDPVEVTGCSGNVWNVRSSIVLPPCLDHNLPGRGRWSSGYLELDGFKFSADAISSLGSFDLAISSDVIGTGSLAERPLFASQAFAQKLRKISPKAFQFFPARVE